MFSNYVPLRGELSLFKRTYTSLSQCILSISNIRNFFHNYPTVPYAHASVNPNCTGTIFRLTSKYARLASRLLIIPTIDACLEFTAGDIGSPLGGNSIWAPVLRATPATPFLGTPGLSVCHSARASLANPIAALSFAYRPAPTVWSPPRFSLDHLTGTCPSINWDSVVLRTPCSLLVAWSRPMARMLGMQTCWRPAHRPSTAWGNWAVLFLLVMYPPDATHTNPRLGEVVDHTPVTSNCTRAVWPPLIRAGGGLQRAVAQRREILSLHEQGAGAVALNPWGKWYGNDAHMLNVKFIEDSIGGSIADSTRKNYKGHFEQWSTFRRINGLSPYLSADPQGLPDEEDSVLSYLALSVGPLGKDIATVVGHLNALSYFRRARSGFNPISHMPRVSLMIRGLRRANGPTQR